MERGLRGEGGREGRICMAIEKHADPVIYLET